MMNLRSIVVSTLSVLAAFVFTAIVPLNPGALAQIQGGTLIVGLESGVLGFDAFYVGRIDPTPANAVLEYLFGIDPETQAMVPKLGNSLFNLTLALGVLIVPAYTRVARANTLTFAQRDFVMAARALGASHTRILPREILPNVLLPVFAYSFVLVALIIVLEGVLSFLGLGVPHPAPSWGSMINDGREHLSEAPHIAFIPAMVMFLTVFSFNLLGDILRKRIDTRSASL